MTVLQSEYAKVVQKFENLMPCGIAAEVRL